MKTLEIHFKRLIMLSFICSSFFFISCEKEERDPCSGMHCRNGGVCISGECFCFNGYSGKYCERSGSGSGGGGSSSSYCRQNVEGCEPHKWSCTSSAFCYSSKQACIDSGTCRAGGKGYNYNGNEDQEEIVGQIGMASESVEMKAQGQVVFWAKSDMDCGNITVQFNGMTERIPYSLKDAPECGADGNASFSLPPGTYFYKASCNDYMWTGNVEVKANTCFRLKLSIN